MVVKEFFGHVWDLFRCLFRRVVFFGGLITSRLWVAVAVVALILASLITVLVNQSSRIDGLEEKINRLQGGEEQPSEE